MRSDEQMPGTVTRGPGARVAARLGGRWSDLVWEASTTTAADRRRAGHRPRGKPNLSHAHAPGTSGTGARANAALEQRKSDIPVLAGRGRPATCPEEMRPRKGQADDALAGVLWAVQPIQMILDSAGRTRCPADLVGDADHTLPGRVGPGLPTTNRTQAGGGTGKGKSNHGCL